jgi:hypothetical protein
MTAQVPPARQPPPAEALLDAVALVEAISAEDVEGVAALLRNARLSECAQVLDRLLAAGLLSTPLHRAFTVLREVAGDIGRDSSPGNVVLRLGHTLAEEWGEAVALGHFRQWALERARP